MNKETMRNNITLLTQMVNSIRGVTEISEEQELCPADVQLFLHEIKNNKDVVARHDIETADLRQALTNTLNNKEVLQSRLTEINNRFKLATTQLEDMDDALEEMKAKVKHSYIEAEIKHKVRLHKEEEEFYKNKYTETSTMYKELATAFNDLLSYKSSDDLKELAVTFAKHATPKLIIPDFEEKEPTQK